MSFVFWLIVIRHVYVWNVAWKSSTHVYKGCVHIYIVASLLTHTHTQMYTHIHCIYIYIYVYAYIRYVNMYTFPYWLRLYAYIYIQWFKAVCVYLCTFVPGSSSSQVARHQATNRSSTPNFGKQMCVSRCRTEPWWSQGWCLKITCRWLKKLRKPWQLWCKPFNQHLGEKNPWTREKVKRENHDLKIAGLLNSFGS